VDVFGWAIFAVGFIWRILDECAAKVLFRLGAVVGRIYERSQEEQ